MLATWLTLSRLPLLLATVLALYRGPGPLRLAAAALLLVGLLLDTVDGLVARRMGQTSLAGSVLDIAADRIYELVLWVCFADLGLIPVTIPLVIIARTTLTDALRSLGVSRGEPPLEQARGGVSRFLVASSWMRTGYATGKIVVFCGLAVAHAIGGNGAGLLRPLGALAWIVVGICVLRGVPVVAGSLRIGRLHPSWSERHRAGPTPS